jgi:hypothetical protein
MAIAKEIGDLSWQEVTDLRKAMAKTLGLESFDKFGDKWKIGALKKGISQDVVDKVWGDLCEHGAYSFNRSHSVAYGLISYHCCWLKKYYPYDFAASSLTHEKDLSNKIKMLRELEKEGIKYTPVDSNKSTDRWEVVEIDGVKKLIGPLSEIKGFGDKSVASVLSARSRGTKPTARVQKLLLNPKTEIDTLTPIQDAIYLIMPEPKERNIYTPQTKIEDIKPDGTSNDFVIFGLVKKIMPVDENSQERIKKRGFRIEDNNTMKLNLLIEDDSEECLAMVSRSDFRTIGQNIINNGGAGKKLYAFKCQCMKDFKMLIIKKAILIGDVK